MSAQQPRRKQRYVHVSIRDSVDVDVSEVMEQLSDETLIEELKTRGAEKAAKVAQETQEDGLEGLLEMLQRGQYDDAILALERMIHPKFHSLEACMREFTLAKATPRVSSEISNSERGSQ